MLTILIYVMIASGFVLMIFNIISYVRFFRHIVSRGDWHRESRLLYVPIILLVLFAAGYAVVGFFDEPNLIVGGILFGGSIFVALMLYFMRRVTDRIQENEHLEAALMAAQEANRAKTVFLSNMSHDIRTPLNAITGYIRFARRQTATEEERKEYMRKIEESGNQLLSIVDDVLEMSRIESGRIELHPENCDLHQVMCEAHDLFLPQMEAKHIAFTGQCEIQNAWVVCDKKRMHRIIMNLLSNACKYTMEGGSVHMSLREITEDGETAIYEIRVKDTGIGMSQEFLERIFTPFEREQTDAVHSIQGTGLGMSIVQRMVDLMGGSIEVSSEKGKGTEFLLRMRFPLGEAPSQQTAQQDAEQSGISQQDQDERFDPSGIRTLLAEDNEINREIAVMILSEAGFIVDTAENGMKAVAMAQEGTYDLILMDIQMPGMDGYEATRTIRSMGGAMEKVPIIAMTANAFQEDVEKALNAGMNAHIAKPLDVDVMLRTIGTVMAAQHEEH